jgi:hypothetical protein
MLVSFFPLQNRKVTENRGGETRDGRDGYPP